MADGTRAALVTGGAKGIGRATAARLLGEGWAVTIVDRDREAGAAALRELGGGSALRFVAGDVGEDEAVRRAIEGTLQAFGRLDAIVSNAGIMIRKPVTELGLDEWQRVLATNLTATFLLAKHGAPHLRRARGAMVTIASTRALQSEPDTEAYSATKGGLVALTHALALSLGPDVRVNCISPGWIDTKGEPLSEADHAQHPVGRVGRPEDVAAMVSFLLGPESGFVTGANFVIDGGMTRKMVYV
ncbi:SDR family oxidoreductase [Benzoatithermus flavus]|uniref:SDR family oxidoreductase n=1 Tax=Benzoatithermus flavus TaxID=3108223 RepID=A0ABU8XT34_9PROT